MHILRLDDIRCRHLTAGDAPSKVLISNNAKVRKNYFLIIPDSSLLPHPIRSTNLTLLHSELPKLHRVLAILSATGLNTSSRAAASKLLLFTNMSHMLQRSEAPLRLHISGIHLDCTYHTVELRVCWPYISEIPSASSRLLTRIFILKLR